LIVRKILHKGDEMKKILFFFLFLISFVFSATLSVENFSISSSVREITIPVEIKSEEKFSGFQFNITYNREILNFESVSNGNIAIGYNILANSAREGYVRIAGFDPKLEGVSGQGTLVYLRFSIKKSGRSNIFLSGIKLSDKDGKIIQCSGISGSIQVEGESGKEENKTGQDTTSQGSASSRTTSPSAIIPPSGQSTIIRPQGPIERRGETRPEYTPPSYPGKNEVQETKTYQIEQKDINKPSNNCVLLVMSEYGNPFPPNGFTTFNKGEKVVCKVEKEIPINEMEKVICTGYEGTGSVRAGNTNQINFVITDDSKIIWKWEKSPMGKDFNFKYEENVYIPYEKKEIEIPITCNYYGGLNSKIIFGKKQIPDGFVIDFPEISYEKNEGKIIIKIGDEVKGGNYKIVFSAFPENEEEMEKLFVLNISVEHLLKIKKQQEGEKTYLYFSSELNDFKNFFIEIGLQGKFKIEEVQPEKVDITLRKTSIEISGDKDAFEKLVVVLSGKIENLKIEKSKFIDKDGKNIKVKVEM